VIGTSHFILLVSVSAMSGQVLVMLHRQLPRVFV